MFTNDFNRERARVAHERAVTAARAELTLSNRPLVQQKTALNLLQMAGANPDVGLHTDRAQTLIYTLMVRIP